MGRKGKSMFTQEELELMNTQKYTTPSAVYMTWAAISSTLPALLFSTVMVMNPVDNIIVFVAFAAVAAAALFFAYQNTSRKIRDGLAAKHSEEVRAMVTENYKSMDKKQKEGVHLDSLVVEKQSELSEKESCFLSLSYNNALFAFLLVVFSFYVFRSLSGQWNYGLSVTSTSILVALFSTGSKA
ncbi:uncharacterized protein MONBRDRAFT_38041 [Monosiga brevicollis MX1]|uniref:Translocon-associated protein subunit gamma n=1 Tax=Monosiga brevicollis TaxID=81824 RepID=A9V5C4_MONBE|nr:uncharacterized protein MONBRDRAFT_38041 [Monosiga brevicollis MX1]EDQ87256.1 predicted protein [Monosiga brevicollis MX1]|eukprot:XP_001747869.1 hypothetical protein [Monosiga brevicollis MX1]